MKSVSAIDSQKSVAVGKRYKLVNTYLFGIGKILKKKIIFCFRDK